MMFVDTAKMTGMAICSVTKRSIDRARTVKERGFYFDMVQLYDFIFKKDHQYPSTPSLSHMFGLKKQLELIFEEGLENFWARHEANMQLTRDWGRKHFELLVDDAYASRTVTVIRNTRNIDVSALNKALGERGFQIANGYGELKDKTFRIAHMAECTSAGLDELFVAMEDILDLK